MSGVELLVQKWHTGDMDTKETLGFRLQRLRLAAGLTQVQQQLSTTLQQFQQQLVATQSVPTPDQGVGGGLVTGHPVSFYNTSHYFNFIGGAGWAPSRAGGVPASGVGFFPPRPATGIVAARSLR